MLIKCPKCQSVYDLPDHLIKHEGLKMRCAQCHEIWTAFPADELKKSVSGKTSDIKKMFERVSKQTESLFDEREIKTVEKIRVVNVTRYKHTINLILLLIALLSLGAILYYMRYDVVRLLPQTEQIYHKIGLESIPYGRHLEFKNVTIREFAENNLAKLEISGMVVNNGNYTTAVPPVKIDIFDKNGIPTGAIMYYLPMPRLEAGYQLLFNKVITNPSPFSKSIYLTFDDKKIN